MSTRTEKVSWDQIHEAMATLERHLALAASHEGVLTMEKRSELERRLETLKNRVSQSDAR